MMVDSTDWMHPWAITTISLSILLVIVIIILLCTCWDRKTQALQQFYILDEHGMKKSKLSELSSSLPNIQMFRRFSKDNFAGSVFTADDLPFKSSSDLTDSVDVTHKFDKSILKLSEGKPEDMFSCISEDSKFSFHSTYPPLARTNSKAESFVSIDFTSENERLLE